MLKPILLPLTLLMSALCFCLMSLDKTRAKQRKQRIPEKTLFLTALLFGAPGGTLAMVLCRHKTRHWQFKLFFPLLAVLQLAAVLLL